jgi:copper chaperone CopZ
MANGSGCGCGCGDTQTTGLTIGTQPKEGTMNSTTVNIDGMTCGHCVASVTEELQAIEGVQDVQVQLVAGGVSTATVVSEGPLDNASISEAVAEAGYTVVGSDA